MIVHGGVGGSEGPAGYVGKKLFPEGVYWSEVDIARPGESFFNVQYSRDVDHGVFWDAFQCINAVAWCPRRTAFATFAGSDTYCLIAPARSIESAFDRSIAELDEFLRDEAMRIFDEMETRAPNPFDEVWLRDYAWLRSFR